MDKIPIQSATRTFQKLKNVSIYSGQGLSCRRVWGEGFLLALWFRVLGPASNEGRVPLIHIQDRVERHRIQHEFCDGPNPKGPKDPIIRYSVLG